MTKAYPPRQRLLTPYEPYLRARWAEGCHNGRQLYREIVAHGFRGTCTVVARFVAQLRRAERAGTQGTPIMIAGDPLTPHTAAMLLLRRPERCSDAEQATITQLRACHPDIATMMAFTERFTTIVRERHGDALSQWLADAQASAIREIGQFAIKVRKDEAAVRAGCTLSWSNGQTEGHINKLKLLKRSMDGCCVPPERQPPEVGQSPIMSPDADPLPREGRKGEYFDEISGQTRVARTRRAALSERDTAAEVRHP